MKLSIIICAYNEENGIRQLLEALPSQRLPPWISDYEIIVVASGCTDGTVDVVRRHMARTPKIRLIEEAERRGKAAAVNKALSTSTGDLLVFIPADVLPARDGIYHLLQPFRDPSVVAVSGRPVQDPAYQKGGLIGYLMNLTHRLWSRLMGVLNEMGAVAHCSGEFMAIRAGVVARIPEDCVADDAYISIMARRRGVVKFAPEAVCYNLAPSNLKDYVSQRRRWLFGHLQVRRLTGEYPTVMDTLILTRPWLALRVVAEEVRSHLRGLPFLLCAGLLEILILLLVVLDVLRGRQYAVWPMIKSTKPTYWAGKGRLKR